MSSLFDNSGREFVAADGRASAPLSYEQEGIWLASRFAAGPADFHNLSALRIEGELDVTRLEAALTALTERHHILRTVFIADDTGLGQRVIAAAPVRIAIVDAPPGTIGADWKTEAFRAFVLEAAEQPFDLAAAPAWRARLIRFNATDHVLVTVFHHIIIDGISSVIVDSDLAAFYNGDAATLPPMAMHYADYAAADRARHAQIARDVEEWRQSIDGSSRSLSLPMAQQPAATSTRRGHRRFTIDASLASDVEKLARHNNTTAFGALAAAFAVSLSRIGTDTDLTLNIVKSTRRRPELAPIVGVLVDMMLLRVDLGAAHTFTDLLQQLRERLKWGFARPVPHFELVRALGGHARGHQPSGEVAINYQKASTETAEMRGLRTSLWRHAGGHSAYALALEVYNDHGTLDCLIDYDAAHLAPATIERIVEGLDTFLRAALSAPLAPLDTLPTISAATMTARLREQPRGAITGTPRTTVPALFAEQARANPNGLAIRDHQRDWSAGEIDAQSSRVANLLRARGIEPGARVGICLPRSADFVIAALGVMKAGAAYVPMDPAYPDERIRLIVEIAEPACIITHADLTGRLSAGIARLLLDRELDALAAQPAEAPPPTAGPDSPAYVLFTSGSTGRPRGVVGLHRGIVNRIAWMRRTHPFWNDEVCAQKTTIGFVDSVWEIFGPMTSGVPLVILPDATVRDARALVAALTEHHITRVVLVPSLLEALLDAEVHFDASLQRLRLCISSGEPLSPALAARCRATLPHVTLLNIYGSSEVAADVTWAEITDASIRTHVSIGRPIDNVYIYLLDRAHQLVPRGETGEICVGGAALAAGYVGDAAATAERFIPDPFASTPGARLFKTGDLGRLRDDGEIEVRGRLDEQLKVLGRRVEPGEIECALSAHPSIRQAAVVLNAPRGILAAFVVARSPDGIDRSALKEFLRHRLPDYMVPAVFITLAQLPLSTHGKIDRAQLASTDIGDSSPPVGGAPATPLEQQLSEIWTEVLGVGPRSVDDDFVALGGHSLRATQLAWRIGERLGVELSPGAVFEHSTVRLLACEIARLAGTSRPDRLPPIVPAQRGDTTPPSAAQRQFWLEERLHEGRGANQHGGTYVVTGPFDIAAFDRSLTALVARHDSLRSITRVDGGELRIVVRPAVAHVSPVEDLSRVPVEDRRRRLEARLASARRRPFALDAEPPFRVRVYRLASDQHAISLSMHHSAFDGWSAAILMRELTALYRAERRGGEAQLPELPIRYADFAEWQRACAEGSAFAAQRDYWRHQLADAPEGLELPLDRQPHTGIPPRMGRCAVRLDADLMERLRALGQAEGATTFMALSAGFATLLARYSGQWDLVIGTAAANRRLPSTQSIIGAFVNTLALRFRFDRRSSFRDALRVARAVATEAFDHQDVPFDIVVADAAPQRHADRAPLFQALFAMQDRDGWGLELDDLESEELDTPPGVTAIPLSLVLHEHGSTVRGFFEYRADLFDAGTIDRMCANYLALLLDAATGAATALQSLQMISHDEIDRLRQFEGAVAPEREWERLELTFARHADQSPDAPAVSTLSVEVTYCDFNRRAQQIAARLIAMGVEPGHLVAIEVPRSVPLFVAILGILQAGAAFVVIDHQQPADRRRFITEDSGAIVLISDGRASHAEDSLLLTPLGPPLPGPADAERSAQALACLVYTSGSSGQPKGVRITHRNIAAASEAFGGVQHMHGGSRVAQMVSPAFDVALSDIFAPWLRGACLCILDPADSLPGKAMVSAMTRFGVTHWNVPPSLLAECPAPPWPELETIAVGGEPPAHDVLARWLPARIISAYGLTEATVASTAEEFVPGQKPAIGTPLPGTQVAIVDDAGQRVPIGVPGQMVIAGPQVADGYHRRPALTIERFPPGPNGPLLHTGDRARWRADGRIEFLGRLDRQLKFHGYRIEPGEIEAAARSHAGVEQAFVTVRREDDSGDRLVAYAIPRTGDAVTVDALRAHLRAKLPSTMCPTDVVFVEAFPRTSTGKIDQRALPAPGRGTESAHTTPAAVGNTEEIIVAVWRDVLGHTRFGRDDSFFDAGGHSLLAVRAHDRLAAHFGDALRVVDLFAHPTIAALARHLDGRAGIRHSSTPLPLRSGQAATRAVAIIGMACRYPKSRDVDALWRNLVDGVECLTRFTSAELTAAGVDASTQSDPRFVPVAGVIDNVDQFDADFYGLSAANARLIDPQQRLLLELSQTALDTAGYDPRRYAGRIGIFAGVGFNTYLHDVLYPDGIPTTAEGFAAISANDKDFAASQVAYRLDLRGPAVTVQTACSTSLVAVDVALQSLLSGRCDMALAGGVSIRLPQASGYRHEEGMILSPDGHCRPFDAFASGTVGSNGGGVVLLKPLDAAIADGDQIDAVILGSASNNDGRRKVGFTAPGVDGQVEVIRAALERSAVDPATIQYVETHGTGTSLGDPIEIQALTDAYGRDGDSRIAIGSIKSNLGHTDTAAGVAGLIKAALALKHNRIPRSLHFATPNPQIDFGERLFVADRELSFAASPRRAAVSAFGIGGTNAHVILEQPPASTTTRQSAVQVPRILPVSARSEAALREACANLAGALHSRDSVLDDVAYTLQRGRGEYAHRHVVVAESVAEAQAGFETRSRGAGALPAADHRRSAWLFSGQGSQQPGMARLLYESQPIAREWIDRAADVARAHLGLDLRDLLCGDAPGVHETRFAQPALFALQYALARAWRSFGVMPAALIGHSVGEYAAACLAGVFSFEDAVLLVCERGRLMQACPAGSMLAVRLSESELRSMIASEPIDIAAINAPGSCVVAGATAAIARFRDRLSAGGHSTRLLVTERAFHSRQMAAAEDAFERVVQGVRRSAPAMPIVSTVSGEWLTNEAAVDPARWRRQLREPVLFLDAVRTLERRESLTLLEIGADHTLSTLAREILEDHDRCIVASQPSLDAAIGRLWAAGVNVDWTIVGPQTGRRVALPAYPFQRASHWGEAKATRTNRRVRPIDEWFSVPAWYRSAGGAEKPDRPGDTWLIVAGQDQHDHGLARGLQERGRRIRVAAPGPDAVGSIQVARPSHLVFVSPSGERDLSHALDRGLHSLLDCVRALGSDSDAASLTLVTHDVLDVTGSEQLDPSQAPSIGAMKVVAYEYPHIRCRHIDLSATSVATDLIAELCSTAQDASVAYRGGHRWLQGLSAVTIAPETQVFREGGTYLVTGGFGGVGLTLARYLGESCKAKLALVGRRGAAADREWTAARIAIEQAGGRVLPYAADVGDVEAMRQVIDDIHRHYGPIHGCVHAAGVIDRGGVIHRRDRASMEAAIRAKVYGTEILSRLLHDEPLDFLVLCSTLGSLLPQSKFGQAGYAAANEYLDAFAAAARRTGLPAITINWDDWSGVGMSAAAAIEAAAEGRPHWTGPAVTPAQGIEVFTRLAGSGHSRVVVAIEPLETMQREVAALFTGRSFSTTAVSADPGLVMNEVWAETLGAQDLSPDSNFFALGGHSLMAIQILTRVRELFNVTLPLAGFLDQPTLGRQTQALEHALARQAIASVTATPSDTDDEWTL